MRWFVIVAMLGAIVGMTGCNDLYYTEEVREACKTHAEGSQAYKDCAFYFHRAAHAKHRPSPGH